MDNLYKIGVFCLPNVCLHGNHRLQRIACAGFHGSEATHRSRQLGKGRRQQQPLRLQGGIPSRQLRKCDAGRAGGGASGNSEQSEDCLSSNESDLNVFEMCLWVLFPASVPAARAAKRKVPIQC
jgi:hypothetical protein